MEIWQRDHIKKHLVQLMKDTDCNNTLLAICESSNILSSEDVQQIETKKVKLSKSRIFYDIIVTRRNSYQTLLEALEETKQSGAVHTLNAHKFLELNQIGQLEYKAIDTLGRVSTKVEHEFFKGKFGYRDIAIRRENLSKSVFSENSLLNEITVLTSLDCHENILRYFTCKVEDDLVHLILVFELCSSNLDEYIRDEDITLTEAHKIDILKQITAGLSYLHGNKILYLSLRPTSVLVAKVFRHSARPKLSNFSAATYVSKRGTCSINSERLLKNKDWLPRTILQSIDERNHQEVRVDSSADIFALGCLFQFVLYSAHPFGSILQRTYNILEKCEEIIQRIGISGTPTIQDKIKEMLLCDIGKQLSLDDLLEQF